jgi:hypothetical protein
MPLSDRKRKKSHSPKSDACGGDKSFCFWQEINAQTYQSEQMLAMNLAQADNQIVFQIF